MPKRRIAPLTPRKRDKVPAGVFHRRPVRRVCDVGGHSAIQVNGAQWVCPVCDLGWSDGNEAPKSETEDVRVNAAELI